MSQKQTLGQNTTTANQADTPTQLSRAPHLVRSVISMHDICKTDVADLPTGKLRDPDRLMGITAGPSTQAKAPMMIAAPCRQRTSMGQR